MGNYEPGLEQEDLFMASRENVFLLLDLGQCTHVCVCVRGWVCAWVCRCAVFILKLMEPYKSSCILVYI